MKYSLFDYQRDNSQQNIRDFIFDNDRREVDNHESNRYADQNEKVAEYGRSADDVR